MDALFCRMADQTSTEIHFLFMGLRCEESTISWAKPKQDASYLKELALSFITSKDRECGFGKHIVAYCVDGAASCLLAARQLQEDHHILSVRCQLHAISLLLKHLFDRVQHCASIITQARRVIDISEQQQTSPIAEDALARAIVVEVRCAFHMLALQRLKALRLALDTAVNDAQWHRYADEQKKSDKVDELLEVVKIIQSSSFWTGVNFCISAFAPIVHVMRIIDQSCSLAGFVRYLWSLLSESVAATFGKRDYSDVPLEAKQQILDIIDDDFLKECTFAFDAAYVLNPRFHSDIMQMK
eukprot:c4353_g1_i1.p1 GENE.c4353_g1_i1~~c4353_g1_i1.p1  ORF type:complete len:299 (-),score=58.41 c4353_g1_i1:917-1813(-)